MFQGASSLNLDAKGRLSVPARYRDVLLATAGGQLTVTRHPDGCLMLFPRPQWEKFRDGINAMPMSAVKWKRIFVGNAADVDMDGTGRVLIAPELREAAGLTREVMLLGMGQHFELWDKPRYQAQETEVLQSPMPEAFQNFVF
jgi:MraZ protein